MLLGVLIGYSVGVGMTALVQRFRLEQEGLYAVLSLAIALFTYGMTASAGGSGFLAVYVAGLTVGSSGIKQLGYLRGFHEGQAWLMQILMFLTLGLQVFPSQLLPVLGSGMILSLILMLIARPAAVFVSLLATHVRVTEKLLLAWGASGALCRLFLPPFR